MANSSRARPALIDWRRITSAPISSVVSPTNSSLAGRSMRGKMQADAGDDGDAEGQHDRGAAAGEGGEDADADDGGEMVDADHRMAEARQQALQEGLRQLAVHDVMRPCRRRRSSSRSRARQAVEMQRIASLRRPGRPDGRSRMDAVSDGAPSSGQRPDYKRFLDPRCAPRDGSDAAFDGRFPGSRVLASGHLPGFPVVFWPSARRLQLRGQPRLDRVPF